jgi:hypothetical protein
VPHEDCGAGRRPSYEENTTADDARHAAGHGMIAGIMNMPT